MNAITPEKEQAMREQADALRKKLNAVDAQRRKEANQALVGKCFKYHNTYGSGPKWWMYTRVTKAGSYWPEAISFQNTTRGFEITTKDSFHESVGYTEISHKEYDRALTAFTAKLLKIVSP